MGNEMGNNNTSGLREEDNSTQEKGLLEAAHAEAVEAQNNEVPVGEDKSSHGKERGLASGGLEGVGDSHDDNTKSDGKDKKNAEAQEKSIQESTCADDMNREKHVVPADGEKSSEGELASTDLEEVAESSVENQKQQVKEEDNMKTEAHADVEGQNHAISAADGGDCKAIEVDLAFPGQKEGHNLDNQVLQGRDQVKPEVHVPAESPEIEAKPNEVISEDSTVQAVFSSKNLEDHEKTQHLNLDDDLSETSDHQFEKQASVNISEYEDVIISSDAMSTSQDYSEPKDPVVLKHDQYEMAKTRTDHSEQDCNGEQKYEDLVASISTYTSKENGYILDPSTSLHPDESVSSDASVKGAMAKVDFSVEDMASLEKVSIEEKLEHENGEEIGYNLASISTTSDMNTAVGIQFNGESLTEINVHKNNSPESKTEGILVVKSGNLHLEFSKPEEKNRILSEETILVEKEFENGENKDCHYQAQPCEESIKESHSIKSAEESKAEEVNTSSSEFMMIEHDHENKDKRCVANSCDSKCSNGFPIQDVEIADNGCMVDTSVNNLNEVSDERQMESGKDHLVLHPGVIPTGFSLIDHRNEEEPKEKKIVEEIEEKTEETTNIETRESKEQCKSQTHHVAQLESSTNTTPLALEELPRNHQQNNQMDCEDIQSSKETNELGQVNSGEFFAAEISSSVTKNLSEKDAASTLELANGKLLQKFSHFAETTPSTVAETKPSTQQFSEKHAIFETPPFAAPAANQAQENAGRLSTESSPDTNIHAQLRKSPSFDLHLRIDARPEESDHTPLLYQDKTTMESLSNNADVTLGKPASNNLYGQDPVHFHARPVEEKVVTLDRSDSEKSRTPFLGFSKEEEEESNILITPKKYDNDHPAAKKVTKVSPKEVTSASPKGKEKRKPRSSLFGTCMCCATVIN